MQLSWGGLTPLDVSDNFVWNGFDMVHHKLETYHANYTHTGTFSKVVATFYLSRIFGQFLLDVYVPIFLYVIISWGSFWIEITAAPARVTLGVTVLLTMVTASRTAREKLPPVSYIHALDIWITVCIFFVFGVIIEYTAVNYIFFREKRSLLKKNKRLKSIRRRQNYERKLNGVAPNITFNDKFSDPTATITSDDVNFTVTSATSESYYIAPVDNGSSNEKNEQKSTWLGRVGSFFCGLGKAIRARKHERKFGRSKRIEGCEEIAYEIDRLSRIAFPTLFLVFNVIYWLVIIISSHRWDH